MIARELERARARFARDPSEFTSSRQTLSETEKAAIISSGPSRLKQKHFKMITQTMMENVRMGHPFYKLQNYSDLQSMTEFFTRQRDEDDQKNKKRNTTAKADTSDKSDSKDTSGDDSNNSKKKKVNNVKVNNATTEKPASESPWAFYEGKYTDQKFEWEKGKPKCPTCGMSHSEVKGNCTWVLFEGTWPKVQTMVMAKYPNAFIANKTGEYNVRYGLIGELVNYGFKKLGITNFSAQQRIVSDLKFAVKKLSPNRPTAKANNARVAKSSKTASDDDEESPKQGQGSSVRSSRTMESMEEDYATSENSSDSGGRE